MNISTEDGLFKGVEVLVNHKAFPNIEGIINVPYGEVLACLNNQDKSLNLIKENKKLRSLNITSIKYIEVKNEKNLLNDIVNKKINVEIGFDDEEKISGYIEIPIKMRFSDAIKNEQRNFLLFHPKGKKNVHLYVNVSSNGPHTYIDEI